MSGSKRKPPVVRHVLTEKQLSEAAIHLGGGTPEQLGKRVLGLRQKEMQEKFALIYGVPTASCNNSWLRNKLLQAVGLESGWRPPSTPRSAPASPAQPGDFSRYGRRRRATVRPGDADLARTALDGSNGDDSSAGEESEADVAPRPARRRRTEPPALPAQLAANGCSSRDSGSGYHLTDNGGAGSRGSGATAGASAPPSPAAAPTWHSYRLQLPQPLVPVPVSPLVEQQACNSSHSAPSLMPAAWQSQVQPQWAASADTAFVPVPPEPQPQTLLRTQTAPPPGGLLPQPGLGLGLGVHASQSLGRSLGQSLGQSLEALLTAPEPQPQPSAYPMPSLTLPSLGATAEPPSLSSQLEKLYFAWESGNISLDLAQL